ncbi:MAG: carbohydrate ABC transporter permease [Candidatus Caldatribacterium sp.]|nr:carbohydrate ABC transporter permease [Candidatus Caldatribacterium sp.]
MICTSFKQPLDILTPRPKIVFSPTLENYSYLQEKSHFGKYILNSLVVSVSSTAIVCALGFLAAYSLARYNVGGGQLAFFILSTRMFPPIAVVIPYFLIFRSLGLIDTRLGLIICYTMFNLPFAIWLLMTFIKDIPVGLEDAARIDGYTPFQVLLKVVVPLLAPGLAVTAIFCLLFSWNEFLFAFLLTRSMATTVTVGVAGFWTQRGILWGPMCAAATVTVTPMLVFTLFLQRYIVRGLTFGAVKG